MPQGLTPKQEAFCVEYIANGQNATQAYSKAYGKVVSPTINVKASELLHNGKVSVRIKELLAPALKKNEITVERIMAEYAKIGFADARKFFDDKGNLIPIHQLDDETAGALAGMEVAEISAGEQVVSHTKKIKIADKRAALDSMAKHLGMFIEKVEHSGKIDVQVVDFSSMHKKT